MDLRSNNTNIIVLISKESCHRSQDHSWDRVKIIRSQTELRLQRKLKFGAGGEKAKEQYWHKLVLNKFRLEMRRFLTIPE